MVAEGNRRFGDHLCPHHQGSNVTRYPIGSSPALSTVPGQVYRGDTRGIQSHLNPDDGDRDGYRNVGLFL
jgi:hypothetical protein